MHQKSAKIKNLRRIAVSPFADVESCAEQIGEDYVCSWRPNPASTVCLGFDENNIRKIIMDAVNIYKKNNSIMDICLKDVHTVQKEPDRLRNFVKIAKFRNLFFCKFCTID